MLTHSAIALIFSGAALAAGGHDHSNHSHDSHNHNSSAEGGMFFYGHLDTYIHVDSILKADDADEKINEVYSHSHVELGFVVNNSFSIKSSLKLEGHSSVGHDHDHDEEHDDDHDEEHDDDHDDHGDEDGATKKNRFFDDHPLIVEQLTLNYQTGDTSFYVGKFNPVVGIDYHAAPGIWTYQTLEGYAIRERIGAGVAYQSKLGDYGTHKIDISTFFADTTPLSSSMLYGRNQLKKDDGGVSNTESLESYSISIGGREFYSLEVDFIEDLSYRVGFANQASGAGNDTDETRFSAMIGYNPKFTQTFSASSFVEYMDIQNLAGEDDHNRAYLTLAGGLYFGPWNTALSYTSISNSSDSLEENHDGYSFELSAGYTIQSGPLDGLGFKLGWKTEEKDDEKRDTAGLFINYSMMF